MSQQTPTLRPQLSSFRYTAIELTNGGFSFEESGLSVRMTAGKAVVGCVLHVGHGCLKFNLYSYNGLS